MPPSNSPPAARALVWSSFSEHERLAILHALVGKLSRLHAGGFSAGDTAMANIVLLKGRNPVFRSASQLTKMEGHQHGVPELLSLLAEFYSKHLIDQRAVWALLGFYLKAHEGTPAHVQDFLLSRSGPKWKYNPEKPMADQLAEWFNRYYTLFYQKTPAKPG